MQAKQITVFGGSGFLGRHAVRALAKEGWRIKVACRHPHRAFFLRPLGQVGQIAPIKCDVTNPDEVEAALHGSAAIVNLPGILYPRGQSFEEVHVTGADNVAQAAARLGIAAMVHVSAIGAGTESESRYARTKTEGETRIRAAFPAATILRPSIVFGPEDQFFNTFAALARFSPALPLIGGGHTRFQPVFVGDVAAAICAALGHPQAPGRTYELGGPTIYSFRELMQIVLRETGRKRLLVPLPFWLASFKAFFLQLAPKPLLTPDQVTLLRQDNVVAPTALTLADLGIRPTTVEAEVPAYLWRFRAKGEYADLAQGRAG
ncbi:MAG: complex I NDUFA9 subunit family protein [Alphaproteobacteria bacterium]|nr:complex I NDUFA9 subunit family protein [Alphaproteobacteria bacterium]